MTGQVNSVQSTLTRGYIGITDYHLEFVLLLPFGNRLWNRCYKGFPKHSVYWTTSLWQGATEDEHLRIIGEVLARLDEYGMTLNKAKCAFFKSQIEFCVHLIDAEGLHKSQEKIKAVSEAPTPQDVSQL